jgi:hypothetical protein
MVVFELFLAFVIAGFWSLVFSLIMRRRGYRKGLIWLFLLLFLGTWAGGLWLSPFGPSFRGVYWIPFIVIGVLLALVFASTLPLRVPKSRHETIDMLEDVEAKKDLQTYTYISLNVAFWIIILLLLASVILKHVK